MRYLIAAFICLVGIHQAVGQTVSPPLISVTGMAEIKVAPDEVVLRASVRSRHENLLEAKKANDAIAVKAIEFLKGKGIKEEDIKTDYLGVYAHYDDVRAPTKPIYYLATKSIEVIVKKVDLFESIVTGLLGVGVNSVEGITFRHSNYKNLRVQARAMAVKAAKEKADALADELEVKRGKVYQVEAMDEGGNLSFANWGYFANGMGGPGGGRGGQSYGGNEAGFAVGQISISATVKAAFLFE
jgi:uncharacterized protein